jgi:hypothetical protein
LWHAARDKPAAMVSEPAPLVYPHGAAVPVPVPVPVAVPQNAPPAIAASTVLVVVGRNDTMDAIFRRMALDKADLAAIRGLPGIRQSLDFLRPGDAIKVTHLNDGEIKELTRKVNETQTLDVVRKEDGFAAKLVSEPVDTRVRTATATIKASLFQAAETAGISDPVALKIANIFAWDIDFVLDLREGDRFTAVYEQIYQDGKYLHDGRSWRLNSSTTARCFGPCDSRPMTARWATTPPTASPCARRSCERRLSSPESAPASIPRGCTPS